MQNTVVLTGLMLKKHVSIYFYLNDYSTPKHEFTYYIEFKPYFNQYRFNVVSFTDKDWEDEDCMELLTKFSQCNSEATEKEILFNGDQIIFSFETEEEALYFKLKYGDNNE